MRDPLKRQIDAAAWLVPGAAALLARRVDGAVDWSEDMSLPAAALLCHDGMGMAGPSRSALSLAERAGHPVLLTGHVPQGSPAARMRAEGKADWLRLPTHPNLGENIALIERMAASKVLAHSCDGDLLQALARAIPNILADARTGDLVEI